MGIEKKGVRKKPRIYLMQSVVNYNGCCIGSDIRCLTNIHESSIIQTELLFSSIMPSCWKEARHVCKVSRCLMIMHNKGGKGRRLTICSFFQTLHSVLYVLWNFCHLFTFNAIVSTFTYCLCPLTCLAVPLFSFEQEEKQ